MSFRSAAADLGMATSVLFGTAWLYELGNLLSMGMAIGNASLAVPGLLPTGVIAISTSPVSDPLVKPVQILLGAGALLSVVWLARRKGLKLTYLSALLGIATFFASAYWEALGSLTTSPVQHVSLFGALTVGLTVAAAAKLGRAGWGL